MQWSDVYMYLLLALVFLGPYCKSVIYITDRKKEANKMLITWLLVWGTGNKCRTSDLTVIWQASQNETLFIESKIKMLMRHVEKVYLVKTKSDVSIRSPKYVTLESFTLWLARSLHLSLVAWSLKKKTLHIAKKLVKMIRCRYVCYHICGRNRSFSLRQNVPNLHQSIFNFLTVYCDKIFR